MQYLDREKRADNDLIDDRERLTKTIHCKVDGVPPPICCFDCEARIVYAKCEKKRQGGNHNKGG